MNEVFELLSKPLFRFGEASVTVSQLLALPLILLVGWWLAAWLGRRIAASLGASHYNADLVQLVVRGFYALVAIALFFTVLAVLKVPLGAFAFVSGAIAIGVGFGAQNVINNFISGWILMGERPIRIGDFIEIGDTRGTVEAIRTRSTRVRRVDGVHLVIPNSHLLENMVVNWTLVDLNIRTSIKVGVAYGSPVQRVAELIAQATNDNPGVLAEPKPAVLFEDFGDNALVFEVFFWVQAQAERDMRKIRSEIRFRIDALFRENGIVIAFPQRDVHIDGSIRLSGEPPARPMPVGGSET